MARVKNNLSARSSALCGKLGFTFVETMVALLIFVLLSALVANSVPVAFRTYQQVVNASNSQVALSTTASALRDELGLATAVETDANNKVTYYQSPDGYWVQLKNPINHRGLEKHLHAESGNGPVKNAELAGSPIPLIPDSAIVAAAGSPTLQVKSGKGVIADVTYVDGVFTVTDLSVVESGSSNSVETIQKYEVRAVFNPIANE